MVISGCCGCFSSEFGSQSTNACPLVVTLTLLYSMRKMMVEKALALGALKEHRSRVWPRHKAPKKCGLETKMMTMTLMWFILSLPLMLSWLSSSTKIFCSITTFFLYGPKFSNQFDSLELRVSNLESASPKLQNHSGPSQVTSTGDFLQSRGNLYWNFSVKLVLWLFVRSQMT
ncbi:uncharacterized protein LOC110884867 isoform X2 [Helianthus annuus]|uniref:uncharacterized protein LOC110884867 isoform X2 n=1 Tax=Helianthus annuus TaxID=4232 RepID=UPI000B902193|nr:uncharacterized protein LOC110884867 isoform X2 [Helianthus annuus]